MRQELDSSGAPHGSALEVPLAAFGTLSNGSDVRLLATPERVPLSSEAAATIEEFFYAAWKAAPLRRERYFAFIQLDQLDERVAPLNTTWGLLQVCNLGSGAAGEVLVVWAALLSVSVLDSINWATHRILGSAFPDPYLPPPGTRLAPRPAELMSGGFAAVDFFHMAFLSLVRDANLLSGGRAAIAVEKPLAKDILPLKPEGVLFGLWDRLGAQRADRSYCTWAGIENYGYPPQGAHFNVVLDDGSVESLPTRTGRKKFGFGADAGRRPEDWWLLTTEVATGVPTGLAPVANLPRDDLHRLAENILQLEGPRGIADYSKFASPEFLPSNSRQKSPPLDGPLGDAMPIVLRLSTNQLAKKSPEAAARAIDSYVANLASLLTLRNALSAPLSDVIEISLGANLLPLLNKNTLSELATAIFRDGGALKETTAALKRSDARTVDWHVWAALTAENLDESIGPDFVSFAWVVLLAALCLPAPPAQCDAILDFVVRVRGFSAVVRSLEGVSQEVFVRLFSKVAARRPEQISPQAPTARGIFTDYLRLYRCGAERVERSRRNAAAPQRQERQLRQ